MDKDHYAHWEWQPLENMPDGCVDVTVKYEDGSTRELCSCDYWWNVYKKRDKIAPSQFRYT